VDEEEVEVVEAEAGQRLAECGEHAVRARVVHPELGGDEQVGAGGDGTRGDGVGDGGADRALRAVYGGRVDVAVAEADGVEDGGLQVLRRAGGAGPEAQHGDRVARVERHARDARRRAGHRVLGQLGGQRMRLCASLLGQL